MKTWRPPAGQDGKILKGKSPKAVKKAMRHGPHSKNPGTLYKPMPMSTMPTGMAAFSNPITGKPQVGIAAAGKPFLNPIFPSAKKK